MKQVNIFLWVAVANILIIVFTTAPILVIFGEPWIQPTGVFITITAIFFIVWWTLKVDTK